LLKRILMHVIAAKAVCFKEAMSEDFKVYQAQVVANARTMAQGFIDRGFDIVSGGTDDHLFLLSLIKQDITGKDADAALGRANITVNKNAVPNDPRSPFVTSGLRLGSPAITTRGFGEAEVADLTAWMCDILDDIENEAVIVEVKQKVVELCSRFPVYQ
jgi:glycine hydroxymethyltransferase